MPIDPTVPVGGNYRSTPSLAADDKPANKMAGRDTRPTVGRPCVAADGKPANKMAGRDTRPTVGRPSLTADDKSANKMAGRDTRPTVGRPSLAAVLINSQQRRQVGIPWNGSSPLLTRMRITGGPDADL